MAGEEERKVKRRKHSHGSGKERTAELPFNATMLRKDDYERYRVVFGVYMKERKDIRVGEISSTEAYARFKSFMHKW